MKLKEIRKGDIITYSNGGTNHVNRPEEYISWFGNDFINRGMRYLKIVKIQRYVKFLWFYRLKTIYERKK